MTYDEQPEVVTGEVGRSFVHNGVEYWCREPDLPTFEPFAVDHWKSDMVAWRVQWMMRPALLTMPRLKITDFC